MGQPAVDPIAVPADPGAGPWPLPRAAAVDRAGSSAIRDLLHLTQRPEVLSLAGGLPAPETFPAAALAEAAAQALADRGLDPGSADVPAGAGVLQYGTTEGHPGLRATIAADHDAELDQVVVTHGSQQALELLVRAAVDPGEQVALAEPAYLGAVQVCRAAGAQLLAVNRDEDGLDPEHLAQLLADGARPRLVYVVANLDNPTGATLPVERARRLAALADHYGFVVIDDDPYGALRWAGEACPSLRTFTDRAVSLGSVSKVLAPGLRVGWAVGPAPLIRAVVQLKQQADLDTGMFNQDLVHRVRSQPGFWEPHLEATRDHYRSRAEALDAALVDRFGDRLAWRPATGGMFTWATFADPSVDTDALLGPALDAGVAFVPGSCFAVGADLRRSIRLSFATASPEELATAVDRLAVAATS